MKELFQAEGHSIFTFKKGDIIIRVKPIYKKVYNDNLFTTTGTQEVEDNSFRTSPMELMGIANNIIYLRSLKPFLGSNKYISKAAVETFENDWAIFEVPEGLTIDDCL